jgi:formate-dependent nitrite reductase cytochrome c552 subunit
MSPRKKRLIIGIVFAAIAVLFSALFIQTNPDTETAYAQGSECSSCHSEFHNAWLGSAHANSVADPIFQEAWQAVGSSGSCLSCHTTGYDMVTGLWEVGNVACEACHSPVSDGHPNEPMPSDRSGKLCGECHNETYFEWQISKHRQTDLACVDCHDPHATGLKTDEPSTLCSTCHRTRSSNFGHTQHSEVGLTCADCHLETLEGEVGEGHSKRSHTFTVELTTCNSCHAYQMHDPVEVHPDTSSTEIDALAAVDTLVVSAEPNPTSPMGFAMLSGLVGMGSGLAPWLERLYRRLNNGEE